METSGEGAFTKIKENPEGSAMICWKQPSAPEGNKTKTFEQPFILCAKTLTACHEKTIGEIKLCNVAKAKKQKKGESPTV